MKTQVQTKKNNAKMIALVSVLFLQVGFLFSQNNYDNFEGSSKVTYSVLKSARLDTISQNPSSDNVNASPTCAKYIRSHQRYDALKFILKGKATTVENYATNEGEAVKIKMMVFTTAPVGTLIEVQLGKKSGTAYPDGTNSQFQALTKVSGAWEEIEFNYSMTPKGSQTGAGDVDQITILFSPNSNSTHTWYFDNVTGPEIVNNNTSAKGWRKK